jgi:hypothetical protein
MIERLLPGLIFLAALSCGLVRRGQAIFVIGLIVLLMYAALEFLFFIGLMSQQGRPIQAHGETRILD